MKPILLLIVLLAAAPIFAQEAGIEPWACPDGFEGQSLNLLNWTGYVAEDTIPNFEAACGVSVVYDVMESNEAMLSRIRAGNPGYDLIMPTDFIVDVMIDEDLLVPLDHGRIPHMANVTAALRDSVYDPGNQYTIPYQWGTIGIGYNRTRVDRAINSWADVFNYGGAVAWPNDPRGMLSVALNQLGYDPNSEDPDEIAQARDFLIVSGNNVVAFTNNDGGVWLERGDADIVVEYSGNVFQVIERCACADYVYVIPQDGAVIFTDNLAIPVGAPNPDLAMAFMDYVLSPLAGAAISNTTGYATPNQAALDLGLIDAEYVENPAIYPPAPALAELFFNTQVSSDAEIAYSDAWDEIRIYLGQ
jgi:spermidine/putrescine transport system substrate-binding protein